MYLCLYRFGEVETAMEQIKKIKNFYEKYDEWNRLERHKVEFEITKKYLDKYIPQNSRILDIGGGPGRYSIYLSSEGHKVTLLDLAPKHIEIAKEKAAENKVELEGYIQGNALELDRYDLGQFDVILLMGPLYHLTSKEDRKKSVEDALKLLKPGGIIIASFISVYAPFIDILKNSAEQLENAEEILCYFDNGVNKDGEGFTTAYFIKPEEAQIFMSEFNIEQLAFAGMEGLSSIAEQKINELPEEKFKEYIKILYALSQDVHIFGSCEHYLYIGKKLDK